MAHWTSPITPTLTARPLLLALLLFLTGCGQPKATPLTEARAAYTSGNYRLAYQQARAAAAAESGNAAEQAGYLAGLAAYRLDWLPHAEQSLRPVTRSSDKRLAADAKAQLGMVMARLERYDDAQDLLLSASAQLAGQDKANALFHAAVVQQKLGRWDAARANLALARPAATDGDLREQIDEQAKVTGFTLQAGVFAQHANALTAGKKFAADTAALRLGPPLIVTDDSTGQRLYRLQLGRFHNYATAQQYRARLPKTDLVIMPLK